MHGRPQSADACARPLQVLDPVNSIGMLGVWGVLLGPGVGGRNFGGPGTGPDGLHGGWRRAFLQGSNLKQPKEIRGWLRMAGTGLRMAGTGQIDQAVCIGSENQIDSVRLGLVEPGLGARFGFRGRLVQQLCFQRLS